jgi:Cof subfamily protein (haloacid dehalogenase superfamily)
LTHPIKLIATDMDGTLLDRRHELTPRTAQTLTAAIQQGVKLILATGRSRSTVAVEVIEKLGLQTPGIFLQGCIVHNADGGVRFQESLDEATAAQFIELGEARGYSMIVYSGLHLLTPQLDKYSRLTLEFNEPVAREIGSLRDLPGKQPINKLVFFDDPARLAEVRAEFAAMLNGSTRMVQSVPGALELIPKRASKGAALQHILDEYGILPQEVIAFGDAENDHEMLQLAGIGFAMENASPETRALADRIAPHHDNDGLAQVVEELVLR